MWIIYSLAGVVAILLINIANMNEKINRLKHDYSVVWNEYVNTNRMNNEMVAFVEMKQMGIECLDFVVSRNTELVDKEEVEQYKRVMEQLG
jgi:hypothetical protein